MRVVPALIMTAALASAAPVVAASDLTARTSGAQAVHIWRSTGSPIVDKLAKNERVRVDDCTREARWCHIIQLDGGPSGWVPGSYLIGSPAKNAVTPFDFTFDPLWPGRGLTRR